MACNVYTTIKRPGVSKKHISTVVLGVLTCFHDAGVDVSVHCIGETRMRTLNRVFRGIDRATDVLSFPIKEDTPVEDGEDAGDIFLCPPYIRRQARRFSVTFEEEFDRMLVHGVLHIRGYDHRTKKQAQQMFTLQESIVHHRSHTKR
ncbi:MAG: rRNA maturation RNase YbeY [Candidatus Magasanikbacteria bacterium CG11_big_fil_rev_8_21_14_0_20_43_7]|uniref:Endoribonuclease YbeY n=1 Tax=Candidatus Magasanikbacteria bacterium CG11_big_fil_rev_8_21_14_0_20_43_7 TaxID=1974654 RepID=A0A2H0N275_9BACT|nr:MAG: rRNA maturation RNase YbeY [Candidatus Magasanikbacteria bacterium CG11_big_fil_rev_8_21_14_0_20_43_7]